MQNEINDIPFLIENAKAYSLKVAINPAPCTAEVRSYPLHLCDLIIVNEIEAMQLTSSNGSFSERIEAMANLFPASEIVEKTAQFTIAEAKRLRSLPAQWSAGDTFTGYFLAAKLRGMDAETAPAPMGWTTFIKKLV